MTESTDVEHNVERYASWRKKRFRTFLVAFVLIAGGVGYVAYRLTRPPEVDLEELLESAKASFENRNYGLASRQTKQLLSRQPDHAEAHLLQGRIREAQEIDDAALKHYNAVPEEASSFYVEATWRSGHILLMRKGLPGEAEKTYMRAIKKDPGCVEANFGLTVVWGFSGQWWRQIAPRLAMFRSGRVGRVHLLSMALAENSLDMSLDVQRLQREVPDDPLVGLAVARLEVENLQYADAVRRIETILKTAPRIVQAHIALGSIYFDRNQDDKFLAWSRKLPKSVKSHPTLWALFGRWSERQSKKEVALRCFLEAVRRDPNHVDALYKAGQLLTALDRRKEAEPFLQRALTLQKFINAAKSADSDDSDRETRSAAMLAESLGNLVEAYAWAKVAAAMPAKPEWANQMVARLKPRLPNRPTQRTESSFNPANKVRIETWPLPSELSPGSGGMPNPAGDGSNARIEFADRSTKARIDFRYFNGSNEAAQGTRRMYEVMGGGAAVLDFDGDLRPDLYFTQGAEWPVDESRFKHLDRLYRNEGGERFVDVTDACRIRENRFSQGATVGDFNSDGFPDVLIGNIGRNRMYRNNGDGTFTDISDHVGLTRADWTTSVAMADMNGDGYPELLFVNYLQGNDVFTRTCGPQRDGVCLPQHFTGVRDRLLENDGAGGFRDITKASQFGLGNGKGLGIVVGRFGNSQKTGVFIANDTVANQFFEIEQPTKQGPLVFRETALFRGLALSDKGRAQACMGIAAGDADGNGELDLFVTNFFGETNALYHSRRGVFRDDILTSGMRTSSSQKLGFGTQFLDTDLDGRLDLFVANGHIDNFKTDSRAEYQMQPQLFANRGRGQFREVDASALGGYFQRKVLGRGVARLDWNGDGRDECVVSHLDAPVALLENLTTNSGRFLTLHLRGVRSNRDAVGAIVRVRTETTTLVRQLTAGDGFHASNDRVLNFGIGTAGEVTSIEITWPSGQVDTYGKQPANSRWIAVEGERQLTELPAP